MELNCDEVRHSRCFFLNHIAGAAVTAVAAYIATAIGESVDGEHAVIGAKTAMTHGGVDGQGSQYVRRQQGGCARLTVELFGGD